MFQSLHRILEAGPSLRLLAASLTRPATWASSSGPSHQLHALTSPFISHHPAAPPSSLLAPFSSPFSTSTPSSKGPQQQPDPSSPAPTAAESPPSPAPAPASPAPSTSDRYSSGARKVVHLGRRAAASGLHGIVHVYDAASNMILTFTDPAGRILAWTSAGSVGFKNARKALPVAAEKAAEELAQRALKLGYRSASVKMKGIGNNKQYAVQSLVQAGLRLTQLMDVTPVPYNGCRRPKKRRV